MTRSALIYILTFLNVVFMFYIIYKDASTAIMTTAIVVLVISIVLSILNKPLEETFSSFTILNYEIHYSGLYVLLFGAYSTYSMLKFNAPINMEWVYFLFFNLYILSNVRLRISQKRPHDQDTP